MSRVLQLVSAHLRKDLATCCGTIEAPVRTISCSARNRAEERWGAYASVRKAVPPHRWPVFLPLLLPVMQPRLWERGGKTPLTRSSSGVGVWGPAWPITWPKVAWRMWCCWRSPSWQLDPPGTLWVRPVQHAQNGQMPIFIKEPGHQSSIMSAPAQNPFKLYCNVIYLTNSEIIIYNK